MTVHTLFGNIPCYEEDCTVPKQLKEKSYIIKFDIGVDIDSLKCFPVFIYQGMGGKFYAMYNKNILVGDYIIAE